MQSANIREQQNSLCGEGVVEKNAEFLKSNRNHKNKLLNDFKMVSQIELCSVDDFLEKMLTSSRKGENLFWFLINL
jgi:hypothetical protein